MSKTYILIDDEAKSEMPADVYAEELAANSGGMLTVEMHKPGSIREVLEFIAEAKPDGLLLDVELTNSAASDGAHIAYDGIALAQQIRTLQMRGSRQGAGLPEFPLVRFSKVDIVREYVGGDTTSYDLFDESIDKPQALDNARGAARCLASLANDYPRVSAYDAAEATEDGLASLLGCPSDFLSRLDARVLVGFRRPGMYTPAHVVARYVTGTLLAHPGPLIDEKLLAVRLGVDCATSPGWRDLVGLFSEASYQGAFASGYSRWWMIILQDWWTVNISSDVPLVRLSAVDRVELLSLKTAIEGLAPLKEDPDSPGTRLWHSCVKSSRPVDPNHGFALMPTWGREAWQDPDYLCLEEARRDSRNPRLRPADRARLSALKPSGQQRG